MESKVLGGRYELLERVGIGGMAVVYKATDKMLGRNVAIKILKEEFKENEEFIRRFKVESQAAASLSHQNVVQIYDVGEEEGLNYIVMELLEGTTLKEYIKSKGGLLPRREALNFAMQICRALEHAHSKHVVHRDIKPHNIVLTDSGKIKVADFGIARAANNTTTVNSGQYAVGSAHYLSPEQARGGYTDHRSDIYSLGIVMYELFTGSLPFDAEESIAVVMKHINEDPKPPSEVNPDITPGIEAIIMRAMCKEQRMRYNDATEILEDLVMVYQEPSVDVTKLNAYDEESKNIPHKKNGTSGAARRAAMKRKKKRNKLIAIWSVVAVFVIMAGWAVISSILTGEGIFAMLLGTGEEYAVPDFVGMTFDEAAVEAEEKSNEDVIFTVSIEEEVFADEPKGIITKQTPEGGFKTKKSKEIKLTISRGPVVIKLEDYTGKDCAEIQAMLEEKGISVTIEQEDSPAYKEGAITKHLPSAGTQMGEGDEITLYVSKGTENTYVPDVKGKTEADAIVEIERNNLEVKVTYEDSDDVIKGEVIRQSKKANSVVPTGTVVEIFVSNGKAKTEEPKEEPQENTTPEPTTPSTPSGPTNESMTLTGLSKTEPTKVKIIIDGKKVYEADVNTESGSATVNFVVDAGVDLSQGADVYYNDNYIATKEVK